MSSIFERVHVRMLQELRENVRTIERRRLQPNTLGKGTPPLSVQQERRRYVRANLGRMSISEMAEALNVSRRTVVSYRKLCRKERR